MLTHANKGTYLVKNRQKRTNVIKVWPLSEKDSQLFATHSFTNSNFFQTFCHSIVTSSPDKNIAIGITS